jgi:UPF0176 protein
MASRIILFYKYVPVEDPQALRDAHFERASLLGLTGRLIVAAEGVNGTFEGEAERVEEYVSWFLADRRFADTHIKRSEGTGTAFPKLSVKVRPEIVATHLGADDVDPTKITGKHLAPETLHEWFRKGEDFTIVDMRNDYEQDVGMFRGSLRSGMRNFRDLGRIVARLLPLREKRVVTVCTGGVRCEKASGYLVKKGFKDVYQLDGGIVSYMEKFPGEDWLGSLYVFDGRVTMSFDQASGKRTVIGRCGRCKGASERFVNCMHDPCHKHFILCETCEPREAAAFCNFWCRLKHFLLRHGRASDILNV